jgi:hypothetical protein
MQKKVKKILNILHDFFAYLLIFINIRIYN